MSYTERPDDDREPNVQDILDEHSSALKQVLSEMTAVYRESSSQIGVTFGEPSHADPGGDFVQIDAEVPSKFEPEVRGPLILRCLDDVLSHEVAHVNWSDLDSKEEFAKCYEGWARIPGMVANILEDAYVDARRCREWYGLRQKSAYTAWLAMQTDGMMPPVDRVADESTDANAMVQGLSQLATAGYIKYEDGSAVPKPVWEFLESAEPVVDRIRTQDDPDERFKLFHVVMQSLVQHADADDAHKVDTPDNGRNPNGNQPSPAPATPSGESAATAGDAPDVDHPDPPDDADDADADVPSVDVKAKEVITDDDQDEPDDADDEEVDALEDHFDVDIDVVDRVNTSERKKWDDLLDRLGEYDSEIEQRARQRDVYAGRADNSGPPVSTYTSSSIRRDARDAGVISGIKDGFQQLVTRPTPRPAEVGPRIDTQNVVRRAAGDITTTDLFEEEVETETGDRCVAICADTSSSMSGDDMRQLKIATASIAKACEIIGDEFVCTTFSDGSGGPDCRLITGPDESFEWWHLDADLPSGGTPTPAGVRDTYEVMQEVDAREYVLIVITDGCPNSTLDRDGGRDQAVEETRQLIERYRRKEDYTVFGFGFEGLDHTFMARMFGGGAFRMTSTTELADDVVELYSGLMDVER